MFLGGVDWISETDVVHEFWDLNELLSCYFWQSLRKRAYFIEKQFCQLFFFPKQFVQHVLKDWFEIRQYLIN